MWFVCPEVLHDLSTALLLLMQKALTSSKVCMDILSLKASGMVFHHYLILYQ
jgi:hypothetical protein